MFSCWNRIILYHSASISHRTTSYLWNKFRVIQRVSCSCLAPSCSLLVALPVDTPPPRYQSSILYNQKRTWHESSYYRRINRGQATTTRSTWCKWARSRDQSGTRRCLPWAPARWSPRWDAWRSRCRRRDRRVRSAWWLVRRRWMTARCAAGRRTAGTTFPRTAEVAPAHLRTHKRETRY